MDDKKHNEKYEQLFVLDVFANRRAWLDKTKLAYSTYVKTMNSIFGVPSKRIPKWSELPELKEWDELPEEFQIAWGESVKAVILEERKGKGRSAFGTSSSWA